MNDQPISEDELLEITDDIFEFNLEGFKPNPVSSAEMIKEFPADEDLAEAKTVAPDENLSEVEDRIFKELSEPKLPELPKENRVRLQIQSPTRLNFYWSVKNNPYQTLNRAFNGNTGSYSLVVKLLNQNTRREEIFPVEEEGSWWFDVDADSNYRAEIGFYAPNRAFVRVMFSNTVETPRRNPSPRRDEAKDWQVSANQFARVLDVAGFAQDAVETALAGDDLEHSEMATNNALAQFVGKPSNDFPAHEVRFALLALAAGYPPESLRTEISAQLFAFLLENLEKLSAENALASLQENFEIFDDEAEEEFLSAATFGASLINFPRPSKRRRIFPKYAPVSSRGG